MLPSFSAAKYLPLGDSEADDDLLNSYPNKRCNGLSSHSESSQSSIFLGFRLLIASSIGVIVLVVIGLSWIVFIHRRHSEVAVLAQGFTSCTDPIRRREWRQLGDAEKTDYIRAVKCLHSLPSRVSGEGKISDDFSWVHGHLGGFSQSIHFRGIYCTADSILAHNAGPFLPWHRYFIHLYESALQDICGYKGHLPYVQVKPL